MGCLLILKMGLLKMKSQIIFVLVYFFVVLAKFRGTPP